MTWTLAAAGDIMLRHALGDRPAYGWLRDADLAFANLEVPLCSHPSAGVSAVPARASPAPPEVHESAVFLFTRWDEIKSR